MPLSAQSPYEFLRALHPDAALKLLIEYVQTQQAGGALACFLDEQVTIAQSAETARDKNRRGEAVPGQMKPGQMKSGQNEISLEQPLLTALLEDYRLADGVLLEELPEEARASFEARVYFPSGYSGLRIVCQRKTPQGREGEGEPGDRMPPEHDLYIEQEDGRLTLYLSRDGLEDNDCRAVFEDDGVRVYANFQRGVCAVSFSERGGQIMKRQPTAGL